jgi:hypothetical protein
VTAPTSRAADLSVHPTATSSLLRLGWLHFWTLAGILGGLLGLVALVFFAHLTSR